MFGPDGSDASRVYDRHTRESKNSFTIKVMEVMTGTEMRSIFNGLTLTTLTLTVKTEIIDGSRDDDK